MIVPACIERIAAIVTKVEELSLRIRDETEGGMIHFQTGPRPSLWRRLFGDRIRKSVPPAHGSAQWLGGFQRS